MRMNKRPRKASLKEEPAKKRRREEFVNNESPRHNRRSSKRLAEKRNKLLSENKSPGEEVQNEPLAAAKSATGKAATGTGKAGNGKAATGTGKSANGKAATGTGKSANGKSANGKSANGKSASGTGKAANGKAASGTGKAANGKAASGTGKAANGKAATGTGKSANGKAATGTGKSANGKAATGTGKSANGKAANGKAASGTGKAANGKAASGTVKAATGTGKAASGTGKAATGTGKAANGKAATGTGKSANGTGKAAVGKAAVGKAAVGKAAVGKAAVGKAAVGKSATGKAATGKAAAGKAAAAKLATTAKSATDKAAPAEGAGKEVAVKKKADVEEETGVTYPIDVWFLIADYIDPENVGKFARICKDTLAVTDTAVFWVRLFKRYCQPTVEFSGKLKPGAIEERFGLRCMVIKALHAMYRPFIIKRQTTLKQPDLLYRQVVAEWCEGNTSRSHITYFFELRDITYKRRLSQEEDQEILKDIAVNPLEGCVLLQVTCPYMLGLPSLLGCILVDVVFVRQQNRMIHMKCTFHSVKGEDKVQIVKLVIGPAISTSVYDWWNPHYPFNIPLVVRHYQSVQRNMKQEKERETE